MTVELAVELCVAAAIFTFIGTHWALTRRK